MQTIETDVLVVGTGPCGITATLALATQGVDTVAISRHSGPAHTPRGHITNMRTMEIFRDLEVQEQVQAVGHPLTFLRHNVMGTSFAGMEIYRYKSYGTRADRMSDYAAAGACPPYNIQQHVLEPVLLKAARERGGDVRFSAELVKLAQTADAVTAGVRDRESGEEYEIRAKFAIGADGARSTVAELAGFELRGETGLQDMINVWVEADLSAYTAHRPGVLYQMVPPGEGYMGLWVCVRPWDDWLFVTNGTAETSEEELLGRMRATIGDPDVSIRVKNTAPWQVNHLYATEYRRGRIFLGGDAAHRHPPNRGLGTNTSVQDSFNLAWKLSLVLSGKAAPGLLDSYNDERQPVGQWVVEKTLGAFGGPPPPGSALNQVNPATIFGAGKSPDEARAAIERLFSDEPGAAELRDGLAAMIRSQDYRSNALGAELGLPFRYQSVAVVDDGTPWPEPARDPELYYETSTHPGARLPHAWLEHDQQQVSTFDLVGHGRFTLLTGVGGEAWQEAAGAVSAELGIELPVRLIGRRCDYDDVYGEWAEVREVTDHGALLVRPDHYIAWRAQDLPDKPTEALRTALRQVLALS